jgi:hypothetical protein
MIPMSEGMSSMSIQLNAESLVISAAEFDRPTIDTDNGMANAYGQQMDALGLKPWQWPPVWVNPDAVDEIIAHGPSKSDLQNKYDAARLLQRMLRYGVPADSPDPMLAISISRATRKGRS